MAKNYMANIAGLLGVELGEEFKFKGLNRFGMITEKGLVCHQRGETNWDASDSDLTDLLMGCLEIEKLSWKPNFGEDYFYVYWCYCPNDGWVLRVGKAKAFTTTSRTDNLYKDTGNCFRASEEAEAAKYEIFKRLTGMDWPRSLRHEGGGDNEAD